MQEFRFETAEPGKINPVTVIHFGKHHELQSWRIKEEDSATAGSWEHQVECQDCSWHMVQPRSQVQQEWAELKGHPSGPVSGLWGRVSTMVTLERKTLVT